MREILFRGYDKIAQCWCYGYVLRDADIKDRWYIMNNYSDGVIVEPKSIGQLVVTDLFLEKIFEGDIYREEQEKDDGDIRTYYVCHYIKEWGMFSWLSAEEYWSYEIKGVEGLDEPMYWTYPIQPNESTKIKLCGTLYENIDLLKDTP